MFEGSCLLHWSCYEGLSNYNCSSPWRRRNTSSFTRRRRNMHISMLAGQSTCLCGKGVCNRVRISICLYLRFIRTRIYSYEHVTTAYNALRTSATLKISLALRNFKYHWLEQFSIFNNCIIIKFIVMKVFYSSLCHVLRNKYNIIINIIKCANCSLSNHVQLYAKILQKEFLGCVDKMLRLHE